MQIPVFRTQQLLLFLLLLFLSFFLFAASSFATEGPCGRAYDTEVTHPYVIHATWMYDRGDACDWQQALERFHRVGGQAIIKFGQPLVKLSLTNDRLFKVSEQGVSTAVLTECKLSDDLSCAAQTIKDFQTQGIDPQQIENWLLYESADHFSDAILCPGKSLDKKIKVKVNGSWVVYWRIVLPHNKQKACHYDNGKLDVLFVEDRQNRIEDASLLLQVADAMNMDVYLGAPTFSGTPGKEWMADKKMTSAMLDWSRRVFTDYAVRYARYSSYKGIYQTFEVALQPGWSANEDKIYQQQVKLFHRTNPGKKYIISPYFYVNKSQQGTNTAGTVAGFKRLARAGVDIILPQDGRGTGKSALYWPWQKKQPVKDFDAQLANYRNVNAQASFAEQFNASSVELYQALVNAKQNLLKKEDIDVELWANVEAFENDVKDSSFTGCSYAGLSQTSKTRLDRAITFAGGVSKVASYMFDPLFTCKDRYGTSLLEQIEADYDRPIITQAFFSEPNERIVLHGHFLTQEGTEFIATWQDRNGEVNESLLHKVADGNSVWFKLNRLNIAPNSFVKISAIASDGRPAQEKYSLKYY